MKIFGFTICSTYQETLEETWNRVREDSFLLGSRQLETLGQRVQVASTFALSKLYYVAQVLPLPDKHRSRPKFPPSCRSRSSLPHLVKEFPPPSVHAGHLHGVLGQGRGQEQQREVRDH